MSKIDMLIEAFNRNPNKKIWDESQKQLELEKFISDKTALAGMFFSQNSSETKMRRNKQDKQDCSVIKITNNGVTELYLMSAKLQELGEGAFGRAKLAIRISPPDPDLNLYVIKREWTNTPKQQEETRVLQNLKVMVGDKMQRSSITKKRPRKVINKVTNNANDKFYTVMPYLGLELTGVILNDKLDDQKKLDIAIQIALQLHNLHTKHHYAHLDLKQENIVVDKSIPGVYKVHLIDFGFSRKLDSKLKVSFAGTYGYLPGTKLGQPQIDAVVRQAIIADYNDVSLDVFALKRTLTQEKIRQNMDLVDITSLQTVNIVLYEMLSTKGELASLKRRDTVAMIAANLILHKLQIYPLYVLSDENSKKIIDVYEKNKNISKEELEKELEILYPAGFYEAAKRCKDILGLEHGQVVFDEVFVKNILSLKDDKDEKSKLQQLLFFKQNLDMNISANKLSKDSNLFPADYPINPLSSAMLCNICKHLLHDTIQNLCLCSDLINSYNYLLILKAQHAEEEPWKKDVKILAIYFGIKIGDDVLASQKKCEEILLIAQQLSSLANDDEILLEKRDLIKKYLLLNNGANVINHDIDCFKLATQIDVSPLDDCYKYLVQQMARGRLNAQEIDKVNLRVNKMVLIQMVCLLVFHEFIDTTFTKNMSEQQLDSVFVICKSLLEKMDKNIPAHLQLNAETAQLQQKLTEIGVYIMVFNTAQEYNIPLNMENITPQNLDAIRKNLDAIPQQNSQENSIPIKVSQVKTQDTDVFEQASEDSLSSPENAQENLLIFKTILAYLNLDNIFPDQNVTDISVMMINSYQLFMQQDQQASYKDLRMQIAVRTITEIMQNNNLQLTSISNPEIFYETCVLICDYYKEQPEKNRPEFISVLKTAMEAFTLAEKDKNDDFVLIKPVIIKALDEQKNIFMQSKLKEAIKDAHKGCSDEDSDKPNVSM